MFLFDKLSMPFIAEQRMLEIFEEDKFVFEDMPERTRIPNV